MDFRELEYFVTIAKHHNLTNAAKQLYISQPALSKYLQKLEAEHGMPLFEHVGKQLQLTYAGERYLYYADELLSMKKSLDAEMQEIRKSDIGILRIGITPFRCGIYLPKILPQFRRIYPNVQVEIIDQNSAILDDMLLSGQIDLAFYNVNHFCDFLDYQILASEKFYAIFSPNHPVREHALRRDGQSAGLELAFLRDHTDEILLLQDRAQRHGEYMTREFIEKEIPQERTQHTSSVGAAISLATNGYGIAFLSSGLLSHYQAIFQFDAYEILDVIHPVSFAAAWRKNRFLSKYALKFIELMGEY